VRGGRDREREGKGGEEKKKNEKKGGNENNNLRTSNYITWVFPHIKSDNGEHFS
jgi:hypothetical protein